MRRLLFRTTVAALALLPLAPTAGAQSANEAESLSGGLAPILHLRTYYWDSQSTKGDRSVAWALGGWGGATARWYGDALQFGAVGYTSQRLYGPADEGGTQLLGPEQQPLNVLGQAYASLRVYGQTFTGYRQVIEQPWVDPDDSRMIPFLFEAYLLRGKVAGVEYTGGYVTKFKPRDSDAFSWMSTAAGSSGPLRGMILLGARVPLPDDAWVRVAEQDLLDTYNTAYVDGDYPVALDADKLHLGAQYASQRSVGSAGSGTFNTWMYGATGVYERGPASLQLAWTQTGRGFATQDTFGANPSYLNMMLIAFNDANEKAWLVGGTLELGSLGLRGLRLEVAYGNGRGASVGSRNETDVKAAYVFDKGSAAAGLSLGIEAGWLNQADAAAQARQLRVYTNYDVDVEKILGSKP